MRAILFGLGNYYGRFRKYFSDNDIVALCDNNIERQGEIIDGKRVISPEDISAYEYDKIYILSSYIKEITSQLKRLGVSSKKIFPYYDVEINDDSHNVQKGLLPRREELPDILIIASDMNNSGATVALLEVVRQMNVLGKYNTVVSTPIDGELSEEYRKTCCDFIIEPKLLAGTLNDIRWTKKYCLIFVNTVHMYYLFRDRQLDSQILWWLHEPSLFYSSVDSTVLGQINYSNLHIYAVSKVAERAFVETGCKEKCDILVCGKKDSPRMHELKLPCSKMTFVTVGGVMKLKGQDVLISAVKKLREHGYSNFTVNIIGYDTGYYAEKLKKFCKEYNLPVAFCGGMKNDDVLDCIESSNVLVCSSREETLSIASIEAMMKGVPCIVSDQAGIAEYVRNKDNSFVFESENSDDLFQKMKWFLDNPDMIEKMGERARKLYEQVFSTDKLRERIKKII